MAVGAGVDDRAGGFGLRRADVAALDGGVDRHAAADGWGRGVEGRGSALQRQIRVGLGRRQDRIHRPLHGGGGSETDRDGAFGHQRLGDEGECDQERDRPPAEASRDPELHRDSPSLEISKGLDVSGLRCGDRSALLLLDATPAPTARTPRAGICADGSCAGSMPVKCRLTRRQLGVPVRGCRRAAPSPRRHRTPVLYVGAFPPVEGVDSESDPARRSRSAPRRRPFARTSAEHERGAKMPPAAWLHAMARSCRQRAQSLAERSIAGAGRGCLSTACQARPGSAADSV